MSAIDLLNALVDGDVKLHGITVLEGWTTAELLLAIRANPAIRQTLPGDVSFAALVAGLGERLGLPYQHGEGLFYPDTYRFARGTTDVQLLLQASELQLRELTVIKKSQRRMPFDRDKLERSISHALRKRPGEPERIERMVNGIVRRLESTGESDIPSDLIGELVMEGLSAIDQVAYVRFASVYKNFHEAKDFERFVGDLEGQNDE